MRKKNNSIFLIFCLLLVLTNVVFGIKTITGPSNTASATPSTRNPSNGSTQSTSSNRSNSPVQVQFDCEKFTTQINAFRHFMSEKVGKRMNNWFTFKFRPRSKTSGNDKKAQGMIPEAIGKDEGSLSNDKFEEFSTNSNFEEGIAAGAAASPDLYEEMEGEHPATTPASESPPVPSRSSSLSSSGSISGSSRRLRAVARSVLSVGSSVARFMYPKYTIRAMTAGYSATKGFFSSIASSVKRFFLGRYIRLKERYMKTKCLIAMFESDIMGKDPVTIDILSREIMTKLGYSNVSTGPCNGDGHNYNYNPPYSAQAVEDHLVYGCPMNDWDYMTEVNPLVGTPNYGFSQEGVAHFKEIYDRKFKNFGMMERKVSKFVNAFSKLWSKGAREKILSMTKGVNDVTVIVRLCGNAVAGIGMELSLGMYFYMGREVDVDGNVIKFERQVGGFFSIDVVWSTNVGFSLGICVDVFGLKPEDTLTLPIAEIGMGATIGAVNTGLNIAVVPGEPRAIDTQLKAQERTGARFMNWLKRTRLVGFGMYLTLGPSILPAQAEGCFKTCTAQPRLLNLPSMSDGFARSLETIPEVEEEELAREEDEAEPDAEEEAEGEVLVHRNRRGRPILIKFYDKTDRAHLERLNSCVHKFKGNFEAYRDNPPVEPKTFTSAEIAQINAYTQTVARDRIAEQAANKVAWEAMLKRVEDKISAKLPTAVPHAPSAPTANPVR